jgi:hypothetical protein
MISIDVIELYDIYPLSEWIISKITFNKINQLNKHEAKFSSKKYRANN